MIKYEFSRFSEKKNIIHIFKDQDLYLEQIYISSHKHFLTFKLTKQDC